jgi:hypothetical protein
LKRKGVGRKRRESEIVFEKVARHPGYEGRALDVQEGWPAKLVLPLSRGRGVGLRVRFRRAAGETVPGNLTTSNQ